MACRWHLTFQSSLCAGGIVVRSHGRLLTLLPPHQRALNWDGRQGMSAVSWLRTPQVGAGPVLLPPTPPGLPASPQEGPCFRPRLPLSLNLWPRTCGPDAPAEPGFFCAQQSLLFPASWPLQMLFLLPRLAPLNFWPQPVLPDFKIIEGPKELLFAYHTY